MSLQLPPADPADILIIINGGVVDKVEAPAGLSVQVRSYDRPGSGELCRDDQDRVCRVNWIKEPGEANAEDDVLSPMKAQQILERGRGVDWKAEVGRMAEIMRIDDGVHAQLMLRPEIKFYPTGRWCAIELNGACQGYIQGDGDGHSRAWSLHLGDKAPSWLKGVRDSGPYPTLNAAQFGIARGRDEFMRQGQL